MTHATRTLLALAAATLVALPAWAQTYPTKPVRIIVPFSAGGPADIYARYLGQRLEKSMGQSFVIENRPGGGGDHRHRRGREGGARRLHAADDVEHPHGQRVAGARTSRSS